MTDPCLRSARTQSWRRDFIDRNKARCHYCNRQATTDQGPDERPWHIDHKKPLARGGTDDEENLVLACKRCNLTKGTKSYKDFVEFAQMAFWQPDDDWRASEWELDRLTDAYQFADAGWPLKHGTDPDTRKWRVDRSGLRIWKIDPEQEEPAGHTVVIAPLLLPQYPEQYRQDAINVLNLIEQMHALLPKLVAEVRMLRAEAVEGESAKRDDDLADDAAFRIAD